MPGTISLRSVYNNIPLERFTQAANNPHVADDSPLRPETRQMKMQLMGKKVGNLLRGAAWRQERDFALYNSFCTALENEFDAGDVRAALTRHNVQHAQRPTVAQAREIINELQAQNRPQGGREINERDAGDNESLYESMDGQDPIYAEIHPPGEQNSDNESLYENMDGQDPVYAEIPPEQNSDNESLYESMDGQDPVYAEIPPPEHNSDGDNVSNYEPLPLVHSSDGDNVSNYEPLPLVHSSDGDNVSNYEPLPLVHNSDNESLYESMDGTGERDYESMDGSGERDYESMDGRAHYEPLGRLDQPNPYDTVGDPARDDVGRARAATVSGGDSTHQNVESGIVDRARSASVSGGATPAAPRVTKRRSK